MCVLVSHRLLNIPHSQLFIQSCSASLMSTPGRTSCCSLGHRALPRSAPGHTVTLCHCSCLCYLFGIYTHRTGKKSSVCHPEWASDRMPMVRLQFPPIWWLFFKWMLLNSYKIHRSRQNLDKSQHVPLEPTPNINSSQVFCHLLKEGF